MGTAKKLLTIVGARPQFIKAAAVSRAIAAREGLEERIVHTGQHFDPEMSDRFFAELAIPRPTHHLGIHGGGHGEMTGRMLAALETVLLDERPDCVLIYGDTNSTLAGALAAAKLHVPVAHVEAGMRSFDRRMPEEVNRVVSDHLSTLLFCPTSTAVENLAREGMTANVFHVGDVMYDSCLYARERSLARSDILARHGLQDRAYAVATVHRAGNTDDPARLAAILAYLQAEAAHLPVILPLHPRTAQRIEAFGLAPAPLLVVPPVGFLDMTRLVAGAARVYTDSGGLQKEAYFHRTPCVTLRSETEWVETVAAGWNRLWQGPDYLPRREIDEYGDGRAAHRIVERLFHQDGSC